MAALRCALKPGHAPSTSRPFCTSSLALQPPLSGPSRIQRPQAAGVRDHCSSSEATRRPDGMEQLGNPAVRLRQGPSLPPGSGTASTCPGACAQMRGRGRRSNHPVPKGQGQDAGTTHSARETMGQTAGLSTGRGREGPGRGGSLTAPPLGPGGCSEAQRGPQRGRMEPHPSQDAGRGGAFSVAWPTPLPRKPDPPPGAPKREAPSWGWVCVVSGRGPGSPVSAHPPPHATAHLGRCACHHPVSSPTADLGRTPAPRAFPGAPARPSSHQGRCFAEKPLYVARWALGSPAAGQPAVGSGCLCSQARLRTGQKY